ncbi:MAG: pirin family protein [Spirochaetales bacterium]|nr:pirin family protein [Spirochaetales bacterium]
MDREIRSWRKSKPVMEGAGVHLKRAFGFGDPQEADPFLLLDDFRGKKPSDYQKGFPWHPHRGIETITYILKGKVEHQDSMGNKGVIGAGDVQWMTAGRGIIHQEMPAGAEDGELEGFQLWANLPAKNKLMKPRYQEVASSAIPVKVLEDGSSIRVICGRWDTVGGPVEDIMTDPDYLDVTLAPGADLWHKIPGGKNAFAYVIDGQGRFGESAVLGNETLAFFTDGDRLRLRAEKNHPFRFLLCTGLGLGEPVAWHGPIVMNTRDELVNAFQELEKGTFLGE